MRYSTICQFSLKKKGFILNFRERSQNQPSSTILKLQIIFRTLVSDLPNSFFIRLNHISLNLYPLQSALLHQGIHFYQSDFSSLFDDFYFLTCMHAFYTLKLSVALRNKLQSQNVILVVPPKNYHECNVFHSLHLQVLQLLRDHISWLQILNSPVLPSDFFCNDNVHFSKHGEIEMFRFLSDFVGSLGRQFEENPALTTPEISSPRSISIQGRADMTGRRHPLNQHHERQHYLPRVIKKVAVASSVRKLNQTNIAKPQTHFITIITDSLYRIIISPQTISTVNTAADTLFSFPYTAIVSPGSTCRTLFIDLPEVGEISSITSLITLVAAGNNEILNYQSLVVDSLCSKGLKLCKKCSHSTSRPMRHKEQYVQIALQRFKNFHKNAHIYPTAD